jgi:hypothetical protein
MTYHETKDNFGEYLAHLAEQYPEANEDDLKRLAFASVMSENQEDETDQQAT